MLPVGVAKDEQEMMEIVASCGDVGGYGLLEHLQRSAWSVKGDAHVKMR
jgi:hypothetical protein